MERPATRLKADITIFCDNIKFHKVSTKKSAAAMAAVDHGEGCDRHPGRFAILLDKGYIGIEALIRLVFVCCILILQTYLLTICLSFAVQSFQKKRHATAVLIWMSWNGIIISVLTG